MRVETTNGFNSRLEMIDEEIKRVRNKINELYQHFSRLQGEIAVNEQMHKEIEIVMQKIERKQEEHSLQIQRWVGGIGFALALPMLFLAIMKVIEIIAQ